MVYVYTGILSRKREVLPFVTKWMDLEDIVLSVIVQSQKEKYCTIPLI